LLLHKPVMPLSIDRSIATVSPALERVKGIEPSSLAKWFRVVQNGLFHWAIQLRCRAFPALLALKTIE